MTPDHIKQGEKVDRDGLYTMRSDWYHDDCCVDVSVSSTGLRMMTCPAKFYAFAPFNPDRIERPTSTAFSFGRAAHAVLLEGKLPSREFAVSPHEQFTTKAARTWKDRAARIGLDILRPSELRLIADIYQAMARHPVVQAGALQGLVEVAMIWRDQETGIWLKSKPDALPLDDAYVDTKFVVDASLRATELSIAKSRYDQQAALVGAGMAHVLKRPMANAALFCVEKSAPHVAELWEFHDSYIAAGHASNRTALKTMRACLDADHWPGHDHDAETIAPPKYLLDRALGQQTYDIGSLEDLT